MENSGSLWKVKEIGEVLTLQRGFDITKAAQRPGRVPVISSGGVGSFHDTPAATAPGVIIGRKGTLGKVFYATEDYWPHDTTLWVKDFKGNNPRFVYYFFRTLDLERHNTGSSNPTLNRNHVHPIKVPWPEAKEQQAIAEVLSALDEKISTNERITSTTADLCRAMMQALWKQGSVPSLVNDYPLTDKTWRRTTLGRLCAEGGGSIQTGPFGSQLHASDYVESGTPSVMPQNIGDNVISEEGIARISDSDVHRLSKYQLAEGDIVYSRRGDVKRRALVRAHESGWLCGTGCLQVRTGNAVEPLFLSHYLGEPEVQNWIQQHAIGATMPNLNTSILSRVPVVIPPSETRAFITSRFSALDTRSIAAIRESQSLTALRDTLLPQLVTGKLRIKDAERAVEDAV